MTQVDELLKYCKECDEKLTVIEKQLGDLREDVFKYWGMEVGYGRSYTRKRPI